MDGIMKRRAVHPSYSALFVASASLLVLFMACLVYALLAEH
jgi:hypothetical protein